MKYLRLIIIFYFLCSTLLSQERFQDINEKMNSDCEKIKLSKIKSKTVVLKTYTKNNDSVISESKDQMILRYNREGKVVEWYIPENMLLRKMRMFVNYDFRGRILSQYSYLDSMLFESQEFVYNNIDKIDESKFVIRAGMEEDKITKYKYYYDAKQNLTEIRSFKNDSSYYTIEENEYDENGRLKLIISRLQVPGDTSFRGSKYEYTYYPDGKLAQEKHSYLWSDNPTTRDYFYNSDGTISKIHIKWGNSKTESEELYLYDEKGNKIEKVYKSELGTEKTRYVYDEQNNLIEEQYYSGQNQELKSSVKYNFEYF